MNIIYLSLFSQLFFQTHYQLWQAFLLSKNVDSKSFMIYYLVFQFVSMISYSIPVAKLNTVFSSIKVKMVCLGLSTIPILLLSDSPFVYNVTYIVYVFVFFVFEYLVEYSFNKEISAEHISSLVSLKSTISRISSIIVLITISFSLRWFSVEKVVIFDFILSFLLVIYIMIFKVGKKDDHWLKEGSRRKFR